jgi:hypothetical protein
MHRSRRAEGHTGIHLYVTLRNKSLQDLSRSGATIVDTVFSLPKEASMAISFPISIVAVVS